MSQHSSGPRQPGFDLQAPGRAAETPLAEVLAVIGQQPITVFPHTRSCAPDDLADIEVRCSAGPYPHALPGCETRQRNFFHRSATQTVRESGVVNDLATANVDSVMQVASTR